MKFFRNKLVRFLLLQGVLATLAHYVGLRALALVAVVGLLLGLYALLRRPDEWWWAIIHLVFPLAAYGILELQIPSSYFLGAFLLLASFNWHTARNRVPYFPSGPVTWEAVEKALPSGRSLSFVDIGSGFGGLTLHLAARRPDGSFTGVEISPLPSLVSRVRAIRRQNCAFHRADYNRLNLRDFDVVFAYLSPAVMLEVWEKASAEMRPGSMLLSFEFDIPGVLPAVVLPAGRGGRPLHVWMM